MSVVAWLSRGFGLPLEILLGVAAFIGGLMMVGYLRSTDLLTVRRLLTQ